MFCKRFIINLQKKDQIINLRPLGDIHLGNVGCDIAEFERHVKYVEDHDDTYTIGMGDYIDNVLAYAGGMVDKRWNPETVSRKTLTTEEQIESFTDIWSRIANKSLGMLAGNHEWKTINQYRFIKELCNPTVTHIITDPVTGKISYEPILTRDGKPEVKYHNDYLGRLAYVMISFKFGGEIVKDYLGLVMHGGYSGMYAGGGVNRLKQISGDFDADFVLMGHAHDTGVWTTTRIGYDKKTNNLVEKKVLLGMTGTFLRGYEKGVDSYVEINPRGAKRIGSISLSFNPAEGKMFGHD